MLPLQGVQVQSPVRELRSCMPCGMAKKWKKQVGNKEKKKKRRLDRWIEQMLADG